MELTKWGKGKLVHKATNGQALLVPFHQKRDCTGPFIAGQVSKWVGKGGHVKRKCKWGRRSKSTGRRECVEE